MLYGDGEPKKKHARKFRPSHIISFSALSRVLFSRFNTVPVLPNPGERYLKVRLNLLIREELTTLARNIGWNAHWRFSEYGETSASA